MKIREKLVIGLAVFGLFSAPILGAQTPIQIVVTGVIFAIVGLVVCKITNVDDT